MTVYDKICSFCGERAALNEEKLLYKVITGVQHVLCKGDN